MTRIVSESMGTVNGEFPIDSLFLQRLGNAHELRRVRLYSVARTASITRAIGSTHSVQTQARASWMSMSTESCVASSLNGIASSLSESSTQRTSSLGLSCRPHAGQSDVRVSTFCE